MKYIFGLILLILALNLFSQENDSLSVISKTDTIAVDSILYSAQNSIYNAEDTLLVLWDNAKIIYHNSSLKADTIKIDFTKKQALTEGISILKEGKQSLIGRNIRFDLDKKKGLIENGASKFDKGFYYGKEIRKINNDLYDVDDGIFTTCDAKKPHFFIKGKRVRIYFKDKVVMRPVVFYVNHFPVLALPFATFTLKRGRKTGFLTPSPGYNKTDGKYIRNIAFYYAHKNYADFLLSADLNEKTGWGLHFDTNYIKRYDYNGFAKIFIKKRIYSPIHSRLEWHVTAKHHHDFKEKRLFDANLDFISSKNILEGIDNVTDRLNKKITSKMSYKFPLGNRTFFIYSSYTHDILNDVRNITLPSLSYTLPSKPFSEFIYHNKNKEEKHFIDNFSYSYSLRALHYGKVTYKNPSLSEILYKTKKDTSNTYISQHNAGILNNLSLRFDNKLWGWLNFSSSFNNKLAIFDRDKNDKILPIGNSFGFNSGLKFSLYGLKKFPHLPINAIRHIVTPSISFNYHPDFTKNSKYYSFSGISVDSSQKSEKFTLSLSNKWQLKIKTSKNTKPKKLNDFLSINSSIGYDAQKTDNKGFSTIRHFIKLRTGQFKTKNFYINFLPDFSLFQNPYKIKIKDFETKEWKAGIENWTFNAVFKWGFSNNAVYYDYFPIEKKIWDEKAIFAKNQDEIPTNKISKIQKKWNLDFSLDLNTNKKLYDKKDYSGSFRASFKINPTKNWHIDYQNYYDVKSKKLISYTIVLSRDLHCWKIVFKYTKQSGYWSYSFRLFNIKLPDTLKFKTSDSKRF